MIFSVFNPFPIQVTENFISDEFVDASHTDQDFFEIEDNVIHIAQAIRSEYGKPIKVTSAFRSQSYNTSIGGAKNSQHLYSKALDLSSSGLSKFLENHKSNNTVFWNELLDLGLGGFGFISDSAVHVDTRNSSMLAFWDYRKKKELVKRTGLLGLLAILFAFITYKSYK